MRINGEWWIKGTSVHLANRLSFYEGGKMALWSFRSLFRHHQMLSQHQRPKRSIVEYFATFANRRAHFLGREWPFVWELPNVERFGKRPGDTIEQCRRRERNDRNTTWPQSFEVREHGFPRLAALEMFHKPHAEYDICLPVERHRQHVVLVQTDDAVVANAVL